MSPRTWLTRLERQVPGWRFWHADPGGKWWGAPAPAGTPTTALVGTPARIGPFRTPQELREAARQRYGWTDHCATCGVLARECGHRQPEQRVSP